MRRETGAREDTVTRCLVSREVRAVTHTVPAPPASLGCGIRLWVGVWQRGPVA